MANTFLNTGVTGLASSNPQANVQQVSNNTQGGQTVTPVNNNQVGQTPYQTPQQNQVSPITIPIQIQPQIAQSGQNQTTQTQSNQNLQTYNNQSQFQQAPTPQTYKAQNNSNTNSYIDFNQVYSTYQSQYGTNTGATSIGNSGIKKTSIGTTIVTPTTANLNSVEGQYQSAYADTINGLISEMLTQMKNGFSYEPTQDMSLRVASEYAANSTLQSLAGSGVLNSSATAERVARIVSELIPQYEEKAHSRWIEYLGQLSDTAQLVMNYDAQQFQYWKDAKDREFENKKFEYQKQQDALENAWKRVDELGYVDNNASAILGVAVGTLSKDAREAKEQRAYELQKMRESAQIEYANNVALYRLKNELDTAQSKTLKEYEYTLAKKYGTTSNSNSTKSNTTSLSTYKDIINNRFANYDDYSKKYTVSDNVGLYNYLVSEYTAGRLSSSDLANLTTMYNVTQPTDKDIAKAKRIQYLNSLG